MRISFLLACICILHINSLSAQESIMGIHYGTNISIGKTRDYIDRTSWRSFACSFEKYRDSATSVGLELGLNVFFQKKYGKVQLPNDATAYGTNLNYLNVAPICVIGHKYFRKENVVVFAGGALGTAWVERQTAIGAFETSTDSWPLCIKPDAGLMFPLGDRAEVILRCSYVITASLDGNDPEQFMTFSFGMGWE